MSLTYTLLVDNLFGNIWGAILGTSILYMFIMILGKINFFLFIVLLLVYLANMAILIGGMFIWVLFMILGAVYFAKSMINFNF